MGNKQAAYSWILFAGFMILLSLSLFLFFQKPAIFGHVVYEEKTGIKNWTFDSASDYFFDGLLISLSNGEAKLVKNIIEYTLTTENFTEIYITSALEYEPGKKVHDRTSKVQNLDNEGVEIHKNKDIFDVTFAKEIANNDIISLYILGTDEDETISISIYLCSNGTFCNSSNYGILSFNGSDGWYNITIKELETNRSIFNINPTQNVKIDYIKAIRKETIVSKYTNISYPKFASIETKDFSAAGLSSFSDFIKNELLNLQNIAYYYSTDSGSTWNVMPSRSNISIGSGKIRIMANLSGNGTETPIVYDFSILYSTKMCKEDWNITYGACLSDDRKLKYYLDKNECGTSKNLPIGNGTYEICDYDNNPPNVTNLVVNPKYGNVGILVNISLSIFDESEINSAIAYVQNPDEKDIKVLVLKNNTKNTFSSILSTENMGEGTYLIDMLVNDSNNNRREYDNIGIIALASHAKAAFTNNSLIIRHNDKYQIDAKETANALLELKTMYDIEEAAISMAHYSKSFYNLSTNLSEFGRYLDVIADNKIKQNISSVALRIYYTDQEIINSGLNEETLKIHYFNETSNKWEALNSNVNVSGNYVEVTLEHLSTFGVFGEKTQTPASGSPAGSSGSSTSTGGGGSSGGTPIIIPEPKKEEQKKVESIKESPTEEVTKEDIAPEQEIEKLDGLKDCDYKISILIPEYFSFVDIDNINGVVKNNGNCGISSLRISLSPELAGIISLGNSTIRNINANSSAGFVLTRKFTDNAEKSFIQGFSVKASEKKLETYNGSLIFDVSTQNKTFEETVNIKVSVLKPSKYVFGLKSAVLLVFVLILICVLYLAYRKINKRTEI